MLFFKQGTNMNINKHQQKTIVIIDNPSSELDQLIKLLVDCHFESKIFQDTKQAYNYCLANPVNLVIVEWHISQNNGFQFFKKIKESFSTKSIPIIITTREIELNARLKSMELEIDDYLQKPYYPEEVVSRIESIVQELEVIEESRKNLQQGFTGNLEEMNLVDLIHTLELGGKSGIIYMTREHREGQIFIDKGQVVDAFIEGNPPEESLTQMLTWLDGTFWVNLQKVDRIRMIHDNNKEILLKGNQLIHQWRQLTTQLPPLRTYLMSAQSTRNGLSKTEKKIYELFSSSLTIIQGIESSLVDDFQTLEIIKKLYDNGYLIKVNTNHPSKDSVTQNIETWVKQEHEKNKNGYSRIASFFKRKKNTTDFTNGKNFSSLVADNSQKKLSTKTPYKVSLSKGDLLLIRQKLSQ